MKDQILVIKRALRMAAYYEQARRLVLELAHSLLIESKLGESGVNRTRDITCHICGEQIGSIYQAETVLLWDGHYFHTYPCLKGKEANTP